MRSHAKKLYTNKKHTKKPKVKAKNILKKNRRKNKTKKNVSRRWRRKRSRLWSGDLGEKNNGVEEEEGRRWHFLVGVLFFCCFWINFFVLFCLFGHHRDMLVKRWANRHGDGFVLKGEKKEKKQGRGKSYTKKVRTTRNNTTATEFSFSKN